MARPRRRRPPWWYIIGIMIAHVVLSGMNNMMLFLKCCSGKAVRSSALIAPGVKKVSIVGMTDAHFVNVAKQWYDQMTNLGYTQHTVVATDRKALQYFQNAGRRDYRVEAWLNTNRSWQNSDKLLYVHEQVARGKSVLLMDVDVFVSKHVSLTQLLDSEFDVYHSYGTVFPPDVFQRQGFVVCGCLAFYTANRRTLDLIDLFLEARQENGRSDQAAINRVYVNESMKMRWKKDTLGGREGVSHLMGVKVKIWDGEFAWRGEVGSAKCPSLDRNFVAMPVAGKGATAKLAAIQKFNNTCRSKNSGNDENAFASGVPCSCSKRCSQNDPTACSRSMLVVHKMGTLLAIELKKKYFPHILLRPLDLHHQVQLPPKGSDYREGIFVRDWYDSLISGYLYHRSGRECWLDPYGRNFSGGWLMKEDWEKSVFSNSSLLPSSSARNLCQYLADESDSDGMRAYVDFSVTYWLQPLVAFLRSRMQDAELVGFNRTLIVCYKELLSLDSYASNVRAIGKWLYPDRSNFGGIRGINIAPENNDGGSHATDHSPELRERLYQVIKTIDRVAYDGRIASSSALFGCKGDMDKGGVSVKGH